MLKHEQITCELSEAIRSGRLKAGQKLPSIREACERYGCNKATVIRAYKALEEKHFAAVRNKSGFYALDIGPARTEPVREAYDFVRVELQKEMIPYLDFQHCLNNAIEKEKENLFCSAPRRGQLSLIRQIGRLLMKSQVFAQEENIVITNGIQQALSLLCKMPMSCCRDTVLVEQPTFRGILYAMKHAGVKGEGIERTYEGLDLNRVEHAFRSGRIKFFYIQPRYHNPLGTHLSAVQKRELVDLARKYDVYLVEDDYMADYESQAANDPVAAGNLDRVIYLRSFTKILLPEIRIGAVVLPEELVSTFTEYKTWNDLSTSLLTQGALEVYLKSGLMERHVPPIRHTYQDRMAAVRQVMAAHCPYPYHVPDAGLFFSLELPAAVCISTLKTELRRKAILIQESSELYLDDFRQRNYLRLAVSNLTADTLREMLPVIISEPSLLLEAEKSGQWL